MKMIDNIYPCTLLYSFAVYHAIYLEDLTAVELTEKIAQLFNISPRQISQIFKQGPTGIHVLVSDEVWLVSEVVHC
jgi:transcription factor CP2-like protein